MVKKNTIEIPVKMVGWNCDGVVLAPTNGLHRSELTSLLRLERSKSVKIVIEQEEEMVIQMTEGDFEELIKIVETYANPTSELKSRLKNKKYHRSN